MKRTFNYCYFVLLPSLNRGRLRETSSFLFHVFARSSCHGNASSWPQNAPFRCSYNDFFRCNAQGTCLGPLACSRMRILLYWARFGGLRPLTLRWQPHKRRLQGKWQCLLLVTTCPQRTFLHCVRMRLYIIWWVMHYYWLLSKGRGGKLKATAVCACVLYGGMCNSMCACILLAAQQEK